MTAEAWPPPREPVPSVDLVALDPTYEAAFVAALHRWLLREMRRSLRNLSSL